MRRRGRGYNDCGKNKNTKDTNKQLCGTVYNYASYGLDNCPDSFQNDRLGGDNQDALQPLAS